MSDNNTLVFFGYDGVLYADAIKEKLRKKKELEARIEEKFRRLETGLIEVDVDARNPPY